MPTAMEMARALIKRVKENDAKGDRASTKDKAVCMAEVINEWREMADKWEIGVSGDGQGRQGVLRQYPFAIRRKRRGQRTMSVCNIDFGLSARAGLTAY